MCTWLDMTNDCEIPDHRSQPLTPFAIATLSRSLSYHDSNVVRRVRGYLLCFSHCLGWLLGLDSHLIPRGRRPTSDCWTEGDNTSYTLSIRPVPSWQTHSAYLPSAPTSLSPIKQYSPDIPPLPPNTSAQSSINPSTPAQH